MNSQIDVRDVLPAVRVPTLVLHRTADRAVDVGQGRYLAEHIPGAKLVELSGEDHWWWVGNSDLLVDEIQEFLTGERPAVEADRVLATVLFTDIVGSTKHAADIGDRRWRTLLERHDSAMRKQIDRHRGRVVKNTGDGFLATFDGPARAIECAFAANDEIHRLGIELRSGLHTGEVELIGDDVGGIAVHIASRVLEHAHPHEIWTSRTVKDLVVGSKFQFDEKGSYRFKGVDGDWPLFAVSPS
jgi:class 3 adenylate cyclase